MTDIKTVLLSGASGFIGTELTQQLRATGHTVVRLVRHPTREPDERMWDPEAGWLNPGAIDQADAVINLSGASLSHLPWTLAYKRKILESRVNATNTLAAAIAKAKNPPTVFLSSSAVGYYGNRPGEILTEQSATGTGFLPKVTDAWERASQIATPATQVVNFRTGLVIGRGGIAKTFQLVAKLGAAGPLGSGEQVWPWISLRDEVAAINHLLTSELSGPINLVAPNPCTAAEVMKEFTERAHRPYWLPAPAWALTAGLGDAGRELILADQNVSSQLLMKDGFEFQHSTLNHALDEAI